ncbi:collagen-like protein [Muricauda oceani]|uniref:Collagen-like protein n=1 Tax=Flagellimonas oceani TaxID=2698672 RepID=A0A6G7IX12_9FLAO|nr:collagen-like protein [Allomuricauda oceani]MBW8244440.1 collagen-like protein [Allomuricauda oceani]QII43143.1 collagen-like protein [Allomuricauda oceani]
MKILKLSKLFSLLFALLLFGACSDGEDGAVGPQGEQGVQGEPGEDGNANVKSYLFEDQSFMAGEVPFDLPAVTQDILDNGVVLAYLRPLNANLWFGIPYYYQTSSLTVYGIFPGTVTLSSTFDVNNYDFRFVVIEGTDGSAFKGMGVEQELKQAGVDVSDFYQVADYYGLDY